MGTRLDELTEDLPKCMIEVNGVPLIQRMLMQLEQLGLSRIIVATGFQAQRLEAFIESLKLSTPIVYVENLDYDTTNNIYSLYLAREYLLQDKTLLLESDLVFEDSLLQSLLDDQNPNLALVAKYEDWMNGAVVTLREGGEIIEMLHQDKFQQEHTDRYYKTVNIYKFCPTFSRGHYVPSLEAHCKAFGYGDYYEQALKPIIRTDKSALKAKVLTCGSEWHEVDNACDLARAEALFAETK